MTKAGSWRHARRFYTPHINPGENGISWEGCWVENALEVFKDPSSASVVWLGGYGASVILLDETAQVNGRQQRSV